MNQDVAKNRLRSAALPARAGLLALVVLGVSVPGTAEGADATSGNWRMSLARSGLGEVKAHSVRAEAIAPNATSLVQAAPESVAEPAATTRFLGMQTIQWGLNATRYNQNHPLLGPLFTEEQFLKQGNMANTLTFNSLLPNNPFYNFYRWKRSLDPTSFDLNHPQVGPLLAEDQRVRNLITANSATSTIQAQSLVPPSSAIAAPLSIMSAGNGNGGGHITAAQITAVPEPTSLALLLLGSGAILARTLSRRLRAQRAPMNPS